jgi:uncharacterized protein
MINIDMPCLIDAILKDYPLPLDGAHGVAHWGRVLENGLYLAEHSGAEVAVVRLFALLHDSRRENEYEDPDHGPRAAEFARTLRGRCFELPDADFERLCHACAGHTRERTHHDVTIQTCWDADRLDLGRVGITPDPDWLSTDTARLPETIRWADARASRGQIPKRIRDEWGIDLKRLR